MTEHAAGFRVKRYRITSLQLALVDCLSREQVAILELSYVFLI